MAPRMNPIRALVALVVGALLVISRLAAGLGVLVAAAPRSRVSVTDRAGEVRRAGRRTWNPLGVSAS